LVLATLAAGVLAVGVVADSGSFSVEVADRNGYAVGTTSDGGIVEYIGDSNTSFGAAGTGIFDSFLRVQANGSERGYNTDGTLEFDSKPGAWTHAIKVSQIPVVACRSLDGGATTTGLCWELFADINESNNTPKLSLDDLEVYFTTNKDITSYPFGGPAPNVAAKVYDFAGSIKINDVNQGSGRGDLRYLIPLGGISLPADCDFGNAACGTYFVLYTRWGATGGDYASDGGFEEWKVKQYPFLQVTKTAVTSFTRTFNWEIAKSVTPDTWNLFTGDSGTSDYTVSVTKTGYTDSAWAVSGSITIHNPSEQAAVITSVADAISGVGAVAVSCPVSLPYTLAKGGTVTCTYSSPLPDGTNRTNTAAVTLDSGAVFSGSAAVTFGAPTTIVNGTVHVTDTNGGSWTFSDSGSQTYSRTFSCDADEGKHDNTATISETNQSASASVTVNCYGLEVSKTAATSFTRTYHWTIEKSSNDPNGQNLTLNVGETYVDYPYQVTVDASSTDSAWAVSGSISVHNPAPVAATLTGVADTVSGVGAASVDCGVSFPYTLAAGSTLTCTYSLGLPNADSRTNTATATLQNHSYTVDGTATATGTTDFSGSAAVDFSSATVTEVDKTITVTDTFAGALGTVTYGVDTLPKTFTYKRTFGPFGSDACGDHDFPNTASFTTNDTATTGESSWNVHITVPCPTGCTLTQGYWKTHSVFGPAKPSDPTWDLLPDGANTAFFSSGKTWYEVFWTSPKGGNAYYILAHQYMAAKLNILAGAASTTEVDAAIAWSETFFGTYGPSSQLPKAVRQQAIATAGILGSYNEGLIGPGHCSEDRLARSAG
jgi:hypothetical protein